MKKLFLCVLAVASLMSCADDSEGKKSSGESETKPATEVFIQGQEIPFSSTSAAREVTQAPTAMKTEDAYFFIRIDNRIPELAGKAYPSKEYFPQTPFGTTVFDKRNMGKVETSYPYWRTNSNYSKYVYDTTGKTTEKTLVKVPSLKEIIAANKNGTYELDKLDVNKLKVIWYVSKLQDGIWHVDGVLTTLETKDITEVPGIDKEDGVENEADKQPTTTTDKGNVEVDIHQQAHNSWDEIKTSIHVRDYINSLTVTIPLEQMYVAESDDTHIRTYDYELESKVYINGTEYSLSGTQKMNVKIEHQEAQVVIKVEGFNEDYIKALRKEYGDGITIEVHTYAKGLKKEEVWSRVKKSTVTVDPSTYDGLIFKGATSAYFSE